MSSTKEASSKGSTSTASSGPTLPPNVSIFSPANPSASKALLNGCIFTRLAISAQTEPAKLAVALKGSPKVSDGFYLSHRNAVLVFNGEVDGGGDVKDAHHEHVRAVCLALKDADMSLSIAGCVFDAEDVLKAGFQLDSLSWGSVMVVDLMSEDDDSDDSGDDEDAEAFLMGGETGGVVS